MIIGTTFEEIADIIGSGMDYIDLEKDIQSISQSRWAMKSFN